MDYFDNFNSEIPTVGLGSKQEPYFSESTMLNGYAVNRVQLSPSELVIFNN